ncbi:MAG: hypothetical protein M0P13_05105 [Fibrobacteraceae bacterium]|nr:hypothetical protein [Fibrobacteraceae bacterium]
MNMISVCSYFKKTNLKSLRNLRAAPLQFLINQLIKDNPAIFCRTYQMVDPY